MRGLALAISFAVVIVIPLGCGNVRARRVPLTHAFMDTLHRAAEVRRPGILAQRNLGWSDSDELEEGRFQPSESCDTQPSPEVAVVLADDSYRQARAIELRDWGKALALYRDAAAYASISLEGSDAISSEAQALHNAALKQLIRLVQQGPIISGLCAQGCWQATLNRLGIFTVGTTRLLIPERISCLRSTCEYHVTGLSHRYESDGLGVPLVALWPPDRDRRARQPEDRYFPEDVATPATAVLQVGPHWAGGPWHGRSLTLTLLDPFEFQTAAAGGKVWPLAADRTTALAVQVSRGRALGLSSVTGMVASDLGRFEEGLYLLRPYQAGKIPVVFVHGLVSSPLAWAETYNELANDPDLAEHYQFWMFLYASGEPIPVAAGHLREMLREAMATFDPSSSDPSLRQMVVVGHSQGGLLAKILAQRSGLAIWQAIVNVPYPATRLSPESQTLLNRALVFDPEPYVRRLVFVATPHGGSPVADGPLGLLGLALSRPQGNTSRIGAELDAAYGPGSYNGGLRGETFSLRNLSPSSRVIQALRRIPIDPGVPHHSVVLQLKHSVVNGPGDGLVPYDSASISSASSELIIPGFHTQVSRQGVTDELRRILRIHLIESS
jgi:pimeloyl-ACP methyl ester carboxylesterase